MAPARKPPTATAYKGIYNSTSTGHQVGNGVSKPAAYHKARAVRLQEQFGSGGGSGRKRGEQQQTTLLKYFGGAKAGAEKKKGKKEVVVRAGDVAVEAVMAAAAGEDTAAAANAGPLESRGRKEEGEVEKKVLGIVSAAGTNITTTGASPTSAKTKAPPPPPPLTTKLPPPPPITTKLPPPITTKPPQIFAPLTIHISGPTTPHTSDHTLKRLLCAHGARIAATVSQRTTTHVVLGCGGGGALAAGKLQREVARRKGTVRFVGVAWALDSIKAGRRLPEGRYAVGGVGRAAGQRGVAAAAAAAASAAEE